MAIEENENGIHPFTIHDNADILYRMKKLSGVESINYAGRLTQGSVHALIPACPKFPKVHNLELGRVVATLSRCTSMLALSSIKVTRLDMIVCSSLTHRVID